MTQPVQFGKYSGVARWVVEKPGWVPPAHQDRLGAYGIYQEIYWSHIADGYKVMNRGLDVDDQPVYVPSSRIVVDTLNRYVAPKLTFAIDPASGTESTQLAAIDAFDKLFARERFTSRYTAGKRDGIIKGDWGWHVTADPAKPEGTRISLNPFKAEHYFPIFEDETILGGDPDKLVMVKLAEPVMIGDDQRVRVQTYERDPNNGSIISSVTVWEQDKWFLWRYDDDEAQPEAIVVPPTPLPPQITTFPVYHVPNRPEVGETFGTSPMRGLETLQAALNQSITDEDLALALMGLGVYATDEKGQPTNDRGEVVSWPIYPGAVIEGAKGFHKVEGLTSVQPYTDHMGRLEGWMADSSGATDAARGRLEVQEAESGIALTLKLGPTLALAEEQDTIILDVHRQMFYDLVQMWFPAYESYNFTDVVVVPQLGDKLPVNRAAEVRMVNEMVLAGILSAASGRAYLAKRGFGDMFDQREGELILAEKVALAAAEMGDQTLEGRENDELADGDVGGGGEE